MTWRRGVLFVGISFLMYAPLWTSAAGLAPIVPEAANGDPRGFGCDELVQLVQNILTTGIYMAVILSSVLFAWAGFKYLSGSSSGEQVQAARQMLWNVGIGLVLILVSWGIVDTIINTIAPGNGRTWMWQQLQC